MKKFFGWLFIIAGAGNFLRVFSMASDGVSHSGGQNIGGILFFAIGFIGLGVWMINSSKKTDDNLPSKQ
ncbi:MAG: hypothetical protein H7Z76_13425 [Methylotenera sp.]|nr:hypothetical protein [Flavobacterium sp.]